MMAQNWAESTKVTISYGSFINQFPPDTIKSIWQLEKAYTKICRQNMSILFNEIYIYIYIYTRTHTHRDLCEHINVADIGTYFSK